MAVKGLRGFKKCLILNFIKSEAKVIFTMFLAKGQI